MTTEEICTDEYIYAPFCEGPSDQPGPGEYAPGETPVHIAGETCADPNDFTDECLEYREREYGDPYWGTTEGEHGSCEDDGTCDDSFTDHCTEQGLVFDYETGTCVQDDWVEGVAAEVATEPAQPAELAHTGAADVILIAASAVAFITMGWKAVRHGR